MCSFPMPIDASALHPTSHSLRFITTHAVGCECQHADVSRTQERQITVFGGDKQGPTFTFRIWPMCIATSWRIRNSHQVVTTQDSKTSRFGRLRNACRHKQVPKLKSPNPTTPPKAGFQQTLGDGI